MTTIATVRAIKRHHVVLAAILVLGFEGACSSTVGKSDGGAGGTGMGGWGAGGSASGAGGSASGTAGKSGTGGSTSSSGGNGLGGSSSAGGGGAGGSASCAVCNMLVGAPVPCPADVATASMCPSAGATCCAGDKAWRCGNCAAETCHWSLYCPVGGTGGAGGGEGGNGGRTGGQGGAGNGGRTGGQGGAGGSPDGGVACNPTTPCPSGEACIKGGTCALRCTPSGSECATGNTCQSTSGYCVGAACSAIQVYVCL